MNVDILVHIEDPGAINFLEGVSESCKSLEINLVMICHGVAEKIYQDHADYYPLKNQTAGEVLKNLNPKLLIVGTSENPDSFGLLLIEEARSLGIYSIGLVDMFCNFDNRFRGNSNSSLRYCPNEIFVPDLSTQDQYIKLGVPNSSLTVVGNPVYQKALDFRRNKNILHRDKQFNEKYPQIVKIIFIAEGWDKLNPKASQLNSNYTLTGSSGSDFRTVIAIEEMFSSLERTKVSFESTLRLHPNSKKIDFMPIAERFHNFSSGGNVYEICWNFDIVVGITSMLLLEASLLGIPTLSILPNPSERIWMPNLSLGPTRCVSSKEALDLFWLDKSYEDKTSKIPDWATLDSSRIIFQRITDILS